MSERTSYAPGTPCWIDLGTPDQDAAAEFYGDLFGWTVEEGENPEQTGGYREARLGGKAVGGVMKTDAGGPAAGLAYLRRGRGRRCHRGQGSRGGRAGARRADERARLRADGGLHGPDRRRLRRLAGRQAFRRRARQRAGRLQLERDQHARSRGGEVLLRRCLRLGLRGQRVRGRRDLHHDQRRRDRGRRLDRHHRPRPRRGSRQLARLLRVEDTDATLAKLDELGGSVAFGPIDIAGVGRFAVVQDPFGADLRGDQPPTSRCRRAAQAV